MQVQIQGLSSFHNRKNFDCGTPQLNDWLANMALQHGKRYISRTFVAVNVAVPEEVLGFYALTVSEVVRDGLPNHNKLPNRVPVVRLGRFAVRKSLQGKGLGTRLLMNAFERVAEISLQTGVAGLVVDAKDTSAADFYRGFGFVPIPDIPLQLFLPTATLLQAINVSLEKNPAA